MYKIEKRFHKVISLFIKTAILIISFYYIFTKINAAGSNFNYFEIIQSPNKNQLYFTIILLFINWGLESLKWKILISKFENISFLKSFTSILAGVTISIFTPNRVGEFAGRIFFLEKADKIQAAISSFIGSSLQLLVTVIAGVSAYYMLEIYYEDFFQTAQFINLKSETVFIIILLIIIAALIYIYKNRNKQFLKYRKYIEVINQYSFSELAAIFAISLIRYAVFSFQYYLVLKLVGMNAGPIIFFSLIALTFFVTSAVPTFALSELAVRGAAAVYFFSPLFPNSSAIIAASLLLWIINLAIPALVGGIFIWKLKFFND